MKLNSLAFRLFATAAAWTLLVLPLVGVIIDSLHTKEAYGSHERRIGLLLELIRRDSIDHGGTEPGSPKDTGELLFEITHSGWYWQIKPLEGQAGRKLISVSLDNMTFALPSDRNVPPDDREVRWADLEGPVGQRVRVAETVNLFGEEGQTRRYSIAVAGTLAEPEQIVKTFRTRLAISLALTGIGLVALTLLQVQFGLYPLRKVEKGLAAVRSGDADRLEGDLPDEIVSLQDELNALLKSNQDIVERARTQVGNLAHALKTPLAVIVNEARDDGTPFGAKVVEQAEVMRTQINTYLDRARMAAQSGVIGRVTDIKAVGDSIVRALERIYRDKALTFTVDCADTLRFQGEKQDLEEMLGNLLDNAAKWSNTKVALNVSLIEPATKTGARQLLIRVEDDGPGLTPEQLAHPVRRGRRLDETKPGSGLGHSIVADFAHSYRGKFRLAPSELGGLAAELTLPAV